MSSELRIPSQALAILRPLAVRAWEAQIPIYAVGGCVRDWILGRATKDLDVVVEGEAKPLAESCAKRLGGKAESFGRFGTWKVLAGDLRVDFAMSRREDYPEPAALPVVAAASLREDLFRRDFTINAMALRLLPRGVGELVDPYGGLEDLNARIARVLHPRSFRDDPTRVFRAARFVSRFHLRCAPGLKSQAREALAAGHAASLSPHRLLHELLRILEEKDPAEPLRWLKGLGYLSLLHPDLRWPEAFPSGSGERLAVLALALGPEEGLRWLRSLPVEHSLSAEIGGVLKLIQGRASPRGPLSPLALRVLSGAYPNLPRAALKPLFLNGGDLAALGLEPGKVYHEILQAAAEAQWAGEIASRRQALSWLRRFLIR
ncbi:MAG: CCA tRNA nucleotidyltransferase [Elusimicrobia bacterium]|nr:CCA tRNA nucleotidyltransferase [Elusimicrobiota bacterium]